MYVYIHPYILFSLFINKQFFSDGIYLNVYAIVEIPSIWNVPGTRYYYLLRRYSRPRKHSFICVNVRKPRAYTRFTARRRFRCRSGCYGRLKWRICHFRSRHEFSDFLRRYRRRTFSITTWPNAPRAPAHKTGGRRAPRPVNKTDVSESVAALVRSNRPL